MMKKWRTILALVLMGFALVFEWGWFWAFFILLGLLNVLVSGEIHFVEAVTKKETPNLYWIMILIWILLGAYSILGYIGVK